jgi:hypothetical protein
MVRTTPGLASTSSSSMNIRLTIRRMTSRGVKCSPAVSLEISANLRISSSKTRPIWWLSDDLGVQVDLGELLGDLVEQPALASRSIWVWNSKRSKMSRTSGENPGCS